MSDRHYQICTKCVMDTTDDNISFDENGVCNRCNEYTQRILPQWRHGQGHKEELNELIVRIKNSGKGKKYDCILGLSGGLDSSYMLHLAITKWGLRPYVFHIDSGWDSPDNSENIRKLTDKLGVQLHIEKMNWEEMKELQLAWFRTGMEGLDSPQDHAFIALVDKNAKEVGVKYILNGYNIATEVVADPSSWFRGGGPTGDSIYMKDVIRKYCRIEIQDYEFTNGFKHKVYNPYIAQIKTVTPLNLVPITRQQMIDTLVMEYDYKPYGQKHFESIITKFLEGWWSPTRFGHDIRRAQLSSLIITGQISREDALRILDESPLSDEESQKLFLEVSTKLGISEEELMSFHKLPECTDKFKSSSMAYRIGIKLFEILGIEKRIRK